MGLLSRVRTAAGILFGQASDNSLVPGMSIEDAVRSALRDASSSLAGVTVSVDRAHGVPAVSSCVRILRTTLSHLPLVLYRTDGRNRAPAIDHPLYALLHDRPNEWQTSLEWRELCQQDLELRGNAYSQIVRASGRIVALHRLHPDKMSPQQDRLGRVTYRYTDKEGSAVEFKRTDILHIRGAGDDGVAGINPIRLHRETIGDAIAMQQHGSRFFSNGAKPLGVIASDVGAKWDSDLSRDAFRRDFAEAYQGGDNAHKPLFLPAGHKYEAVSISMEDAQYIEGRKFTRGEIFSIFGVPPHKGGDLEKATFSNIEHQSLEFVIDAIVPRCVRWEQAIARDLLDNDRRLYVKHNVNGLLRGDAKSRAEALQLRRQNGTLTANEWRELEDENPRDDEAGDLFIIPANMRYDDGAPPPAPPSPPPPPPTEGQDP